MMRRSSIRKRIERLETDWKTLAITVERSAFIETLAEDCVERHLVMISPPSDQQCFFQEKPGLGPKLADFGEFRMVLHLTTDEMNA